jgi:hypothetical protein
MSNLDTKTAERGIRMLQESTVYMESKHNVSFSKEEDLSDEDTKETNKAAAALVARFRQSKKETPVTSTINSSSLNESSRRSKRGRRSSSEKMSYNVSILLGTEKCKKIPWNLPGRYCLRTNMPSLVKFRHEIFNGGNEEDEEEGEQFHE